MNNHEEDTEWNDILRKKGIIPEVTDTQIEDIMDQIIADRDPLDELDLDELEDLGEDDRFVEDYRLKRIAEMTKYAEEAKFGAIKQIERPEYANAVTEASKNLDPAFVVVLLFNDAVTASRIVEVELEKLAAKRPTVKFVKIVASNCINNYPDSNVPTVIVYGRGEVKANLVGIEKLGGMQTNVETLDVILMRVGTFEKQ